MENLLIAHNRSEFRRWLSAHSRSERECWLLLRRGKPKEDGNFWYLDAVEEALCFGWIDGVHKTVAGVGHIQRFSPRTGKGLFSALNRARCARLERLGLMTPAGRAAIPPFSPQPMEKELPGLLERNSLLARNFASFPRLYQMIRIDSIQREKKKPEIYARMIRTFVEKTLAGKMYGSWNDYGRLLETE